MLKIKLISIYSIVIVFWVSPVYSWYRICIDPGHGGISNGMTTYNQGTMGWQGEGPHEEIHTLELALSLRALLDGYLDDWDMLVYDDPILTRYENTPLVGDDLAEDLVARAEVANGNRAGWINRDWYWDNVFAFSDAFVSIHLNASENSSADYTRTYYDNTHLDQGESDYRNWSDLAENINDGIVDRVQNVTVQVPGYSTIYYSATDGGIEGQNFYVITNLASWIPGVLTEPLFYTNQNGWLAMNDDDENVGFWIVQGIISGLNDFYDVMVGIEDAVAITGGPTQVTQNSQVTFYGEFDDEPPTGNYLTSAKWELLGSSEEGTEVLTSYSFLPANNTFNWTLTVPSLSNWNKTWVRDVGNNNYVHGVIRLTGEDDDDIFHYDVSNILIYSPPTTSGSISKNEMWLGEITVTGDVTVQSGNCLHIMPNTLVEFSANSDDQSGGLSSSLSELIIEGTLKADNVTFKSTTTSDNSWYGIIFDSADNSSYIKNSTIERASRAIRIDDCDVTIEGNDLDHNQYGIWAYGNSNNSLIKKNDINYGSLPLVVSSDAEPIVEDNKSRGLSQCLYIASGGAPQVRNNTFYGYSDGDYQVYITGSYSEINSGGVNGNGNFYSDDVDLDIVQIDGGVSFDFKYDHFESPGGSGLYIDNNDVTNCMATYNYWYDGNAPDNSEFEGSVSKSYPLGTPPTAGTTWKRVVIDDYNVFAGGFEAYDQKNYEQAAMLLKDAIENNPNALGVEKALAKLMRATWRIDNQSIYLMFFNNITKSDHAEESKQISRSALMKHYFELGNLAEAERYALQAKQGSLFSRELLLDLVRYYALDENEKSRDRIIQKLKEDFSEDKEIDSAIKNVLLLIDDEISMRKNDKKLGKIVNDVIIADEFNTIKIYPNPFNPNTTIQYSISDDSHVNIEIFNVMGQKIKTLVNGSIEAGAYEVVWDGTNQYGSQVSSGLYFARFTTSAFSKTVKVIFAK